MNTELFNKPPSTLGWADPSAALRSGFIGRQDLEIKRDIGFVRDPVSGQMIGSRDFDPTKGYLDPKIFGGGDIRGFYERKAGMQREREDLESAQTQIQRAAIGDIGQAGRRAYTFGREKEEFDRLSMASQGQRLQSQMAFQPQMDALRGGIMSRMAGQLGVNLPQMGQKYSSGTGYTPSWMQSYQPLQFPRY